MSNDLSSRRLHQFAMREQIRNEESHGEGVRAGSREVDLLRRTGNVLAPLDRYSNVRTRGRERDERVLELLVNQYFMSEFHR